MKPPKEIYFIVVAGTSFLLEGEVPQELVDSGAVVYSAKPRWSDHTKPVVPGQYELDIQE